MAVNSQHRTFEHCARFTRCDAVGHTKCRLTLRMVARRTGGTTRAFGNKPSRADQYIAQILWANTRYWGEYDVLNY